MPPSEYPCAAFPTRPALFITEIPWMHFPALCHPVFHQHTPFPLGELSHTHTELMQLEPGSNMKHQPAVPPGKPLLRAGAASTAPRAAGTSVRSQGAGLSPAGKGRWQSRVPRAHACPWDAPAAGTSGTVLSIHSKPPAPTRGWEQQHRDARDGAARGPSTF